MLTLHIQNASIALPPDSLTRLLAGINMDISARNPQPAEQPASLSGSGAALTPPAYGEIWTGQGGYYVGTMPAMHGTPARHLIASIEEAAALKWGGYNHESDAKSHWHGPSNTVALLSEDESHPAAEWATSYTADGHKDFHLPSRADLLMAFMCAPHRFEQAGYYWSSTQYSRYGAFVQDFEGGGSYWGDKDGEYRVRAVRWIHFNA